MWLSRNILSKLVDIEGLTAEEIAHRLTMSTAETESVDYMNAHLKTVITAKLVDVKKHPNADKLTVCEADTGKEKLKVVCGAPNHKTGDIVALATVGTKFNEEFTVKQAKIRGEESFGMLCSEKELGLSDDHSGIMIFPEGTPIGKPLSDIYPAWCDVRIEIDNKAITHRPDLWSHIGFAREIGALFGRKLTDPVDMSVAESFQKKDNLNVIIENPDAAPRYCGLLVRNIKIGESPDWLKAAVTAIGMRPISNIVDITNYVMAELGEPMHAFDRKKLRGDAIIVRMAKDGEYLKTLDGRGHTLTAEDIVIADAGGSIALAGVMGGGESEIDDSTTEIVLEAANFNPVSIRKTAARYTLRTEAAIRFEKALDPEACERAIVRCYQLIKEAIPGAEAATPIIDTYPKKFAKVTISTDTDFIRRRLGCTVEDARIVSILEGLTFGVKNNGGKLTIDVPSYRATKDITIPNDIVEEVGRIFGYENIPIVSPLVTCEPPETNEQRRFERTVKEILVRDCGMTEVTNYSFVGESLLNKLGINEEKELRLRNPLSSDLDRLRRGLIPNLIANIEVNQRFHDSFRIFEIGRAYLKADRTSPDLAVESARVAGIVYAKEPAGPVFYDAKNAVQGLVDQLRIKKASLEAVREGLPPYAHPGRSMRVKAGGKEAGIIGELHPKVISAFEIKGAVAFFDLDLDLLFTTEKELLAFAELPKFPEVPFDVSVIAEKQTYAADIISLIAKSAGESIKSAEVVSVYEGKPIPEGMKSVSVRIIFAAKDRTLSTEEIDKLQKGVIGAIEKKGYRIR